MSARRNAALLASALVVAAAAFWWLRPSPTATPAGPRPTGNGPAPTGAATPSSSAKPTAAGAQSSPAAPTAMPKVAPAERSHLADQLNAPDGTVKQDLGIVLEVMSAWRTNFRADGNPVGENREITAALTGKNKLEFAFIPADHPAINPHGELCDRWGTPFFFHQISGTRMEVRSAGPDRKMYTADDAVLAPESALPRP